MRCIKISAVFLVCMIIYGCANNESSNYRASTSKVPKVVQAQPQNQETHGVQDKKVLAVMNSGKIHGTPRQIANLIKQNIFYYQTNRYSVTPESYASLDATVALLEAPLMKDKQLLIEGHADERGTRTYNMALGLRRAKAVEQYLIAKGVPKSRLKVISYGFEKPAMYCSVAVENLNDCSVNDLRIADQHNPHDWYINRRVHLKYE